MLINLALKNSKKSFRDYAVYFLTLVLGVCVFYMFNSIYEQQIILNVTQSQIGVMRTVSQVLSYVSIFVAVILGFLIVYGNKFFIKRRKKELGIYMTLGVEKSQISIILLLETTFVAVVALIIGIILGVFFSQFMAVFTAKLLDVDITTFKFIFSPGAAIKSLLYFGIIFFVVVLSNTFVLGKYKLIDLIYDERRNETIKLKKTWVSIAVFILSVSLLAFAYMLVLNGGLQEVGLVLIAMILGSVGTLLFFFSLTGILMMLIQSNKRIYYNSLNMFVLRQLGNKINTNYVSISVVCIVLLLVVGTFFSGYSMQDALKNELNQSYESFNYDFSFYNYGSDGKPPASIYDNLPEDVQKFTGIKSYVEVVTYEDSELTYEDLGFTIQNVPQMNGKQSIEFIAIKDYNAIRKQLGLDAYSLPENRYLVLANYEQAMKAAEEIITENTAITLDGIILTPMSEFVDTHVSNNGCEMYIVVNDNMITNFEKERLILNIQCVGEEAAEEMNSMLVDYLQSADRNSDGFVYYEAKTELSAMSGTMSAILGFLALYLCVVFMITCVAILAIQQLSEAEDNKERYKLLAKLGVEKKMLNHALFSQISWYFLFPLLLAVVHSVVGIIAASDAITLLVDKFNPLAGLVATIVFVSSLYGGYFLLTYGGCKNIINRC